MQGEERNDEHRERQSPGCGAARRVTAQIADGSWSAFVSESQIVLYRKGEEGERQVRSAVAQLELELGKQGWRFAVVERRWKTWVGALVNRSRA